MVTKVSTTESAFGDDVMLGTLGFGVLLILAAAFYDRISSFSFAGFGIVLEQKLTAPAADKVLALANQEPAITGAPSDEIRAARVAEATEIAAHQAASLVTLGRRAPRQFLALSEAYGIPMDEATDLVRTGTPSDELWSRLARGALSEVARRADPSA